MAVLSGRYCTGIHDTWRHWPIISCLHIPATSADNTFSALADNDRLLDSAIMTSSELPWITTAASIKYFNYSTFYQTRDCFPIKSTVCFFPCNFFHNSVCQSIYE